MVQHRVWIKPNNDEVYTMKTIESLFSEAVNRTQGSVIRELLALASKPDIISFAGGLPAPDLFPVNLVQKAVNDVLSKEAGNSMQYGATGGVEELKDALIVQDKDLGIWNHPENILVTTASQQGLYLMAKTFINVGDTVLVGNPSYVGGLQSFQANGASMVAIDSDEDGIIMTKLEETVQKLHQKSVFPKFVYVVPDFQNPTGTTLSLERRHELIALSERYDFLILEDSPYRELRFEGEPLPTLISLDQHGRVISLRTFSKTLIPGFRLGYAVGHPTIIKAFAKLKQAIDLCSPTFNQFVLQHILLSGEFSKHILKVNAAYKAKRDVMLAVLDTYMPKDKVSWNKPEGGLFLWLTFPKTYDCKTHFLPCVTEEKVAYVNGSAFFPNGEGTNTARMNFSFVSEEKIEEGIRRLANYVKRNT